MNETTKAAVQQRPPAPARGLSIGRSVLGALLVLVGVLWLLDAVGVADLRWQVVLPAALTIVGLTLVATARRGAHGGLVATGIVLSVLVLTATAMPATMTTPLAGVGDRNERPTSLAAEDNTWELGMGTLTLDLRGVEEMPNGAEVSASVGMGELQVRLPDGVGAQIEASSGAGEVNILGTTQSGLGVSVTEEVAGRPVLVLNLSVGMGKVEVRR